MAPVSYYNHVFLTEHSWQKVCMCAMKLSGKSNPQSQRYIIHLQWNLQKAPKTVESFWAMENLSYNLYYKN